jgi:lysophospholipase L1-like esterase
MKHSRRKFFEKSLIGTAALAGIPSILNSCMPETRDKSFHLIENGFTILFQGDSITDAGRERQLELPNNSRSFGSGYAFISAALLLQEQAHKNLTIYNRGISGNRADDLTERWQKDCIDLKPDILSILVGVNDFWHTLRHNYKGTVTGYENNYRELMEITLEKLPGVRLLIGEPFALDGGSAVDDTWYPDFDEYREAAKRIAAGYNATFIPYQEIFDNALSYAPATYWSPDGVHPSMAGSHLMASAWLRAAGG